MAGKVLYWDFNNSILISFALVELFYINISLADSTKDTLELVQVLFRHGDRNPDTAYPTDPYREDAFWPDGWGQLTDKGKMQEYELGVYLKNRYNSFISNKYVANEIYVLSSDFDRTIMSAQLCLNGMFPANKSEPNWNPEINWQPVPLHTIERERDNVISLLKRCPKFDAIFYDFIHNFKKMKKINSENVELFEYLSVKSGVKITTIMDLPYFYSTLIIENYHNLTLPEWAAPLFTDDHFQYLYKLSYIAKTYTTNLQRLRVGQLVKLISNNINKIISTPDNVRKTKFVLLSGHDVTLADLMNTFGVYNTKLPNYGSALMMELRRNVNSTLRFYLNIFFRNDTTRDAYQLTLPGCDFNCPLETFLKKLYPVIPDNWDDECQTVSKGRWFSWIEILGLVAISAVLFGLLVASTLILCQRMKQNKIT